MAVESYVPKFSYLNTSLKSAGIELDFENAKILDLYGNAGTLLKDPENKFKESNYVVFDSDEEALETGVEELPEADFRLWNHHNQMNNPDGNIDEPLPFKDDEKFDVIFSFMKTGNLDPEILDSVVTQCYEHLTTGGVIVFGAFIREVALNYFVVRRTHEYGVLDEKLIETTEDSDCFVLINNDDLRIDVDRVPTSGDDAIVDATHYTWFWRNEALAERMKKLLPHARVHARRLPPMWSIHNPYVIQKT